MPRRRPALAPRLLGLLLALGTAPVLTVSTAQAMSGTGDDPATAQGAARVVVNRDAAGQVLPPGLSRHVDTFCDGADDGPRVAALYVREHSAPDRYAQSRPVIAAELAYIDDVVAVSSAATGGGRRVRWETDGTCAPRVREVVVPDGALSTFEATRAALVSDGFNRPDRKYLAFADVPQGGMGGGACGRAYKLDDDSAVGNANDGTEAQLARVDRDCWSVRDDTYLSAALHELLHTMGALQDSAPNASGSGHCTDAADVMCYDDRASGGALPRQVCPEQDRWQLDCGKDDYFHTAPPPGSYLATHWNVADSSFLAHAPPLPPAPTGTVARSTTRTVAGEVARLDATVPPGASVRWSMVDPRCDDAGSPGTGASFAVRCFTAGVVEVDATVFTPGGLTASHVTVPVTFLAAAAPRVSLSVPSVTGAGTAFDVSAQILNSRSGTWTTTIYAKHAACAVRRTGATTASVTCGSGATGTRVVIGARAQRREDGSSYDYSTTVPIQPAGFPTIRIDGPPAAYAGEPTTFRATVTGASVRAYAWRSGAGLGTGSGTGSRFTVEPPPSSGRGVDTLSLGLTLSNGQQMTLSKSYEVRPELVVRVTGPTRVAAGQSGTYTARTNLPADVEWSVEQTACRLSPASGSSAVLRCADDFQGDAVLTATASRDGAVAGDRLVVPAGGTVVAAKQATRTVLTASRRALTAVVTAGSSRVAGARVVLMAKEGRARFTRVATARTDRRGTAVFRVRARRGAVYYAVTSAGASYEGSRSAQLRR